MSRCHPPQPPNREEILWRGIGVVLALLVTCGVLGAVDPQLGDQLQQIGNALSTSAVATAAPTGPSHIGETRAIAGVQCTPLRVTPLADDGVFVPHAGNHFIVVHVRIVNGASVEQPYSEAHFHVQSSAGNITGADLAPSTYKANDLLNSGSLAPGGHVEGDVILEVPNGDHGALPLWEPDNWGERATWLLGG
jgi:Domain of unknown function (DUF4352)